MILDLVSLRDFFGAMGRFDFSKAEEIAKSHGLVKQNILQSYIYIWKGENRRGMELANSGKFCPDLLFRQFSYLTKAYHLYFLGKVTGFYEELSRAESYYGILEDHLLGLYLHLKGLKFRLRGDLTSAREYYEKALSVRDKCEDYFGIGMTYNNLSFLTLASGQIQKAIKLMDQAKKNFSFINNQIMVAFAEANIALMKFHLGDFALSENLLHRSLEKYFALDAPKIYIVDAKKTLSKVLTAQGKEKEGVLTLMEALAEFGGEQQSPLFIDMLAELIQMKLKAGLDVKEELELMDLIEPIDLSSIMKKESVRIQVLLRGSLIDKIEALLLAENALKDLPNVEEGFDLRLNFLQTAIEIRLEILGYDYDRKSIEVLNKEIEMLFSIGRRENSPRYIVSAQIYRGLLHLIIGERIRADEFFKEARNLAITSNNETLMKQVDVHFSALQTSKKSSERLQVEEITNYIKKVNEILSSEFN